MAGFFNAIGNALGFGSVDTGAQNYLSQIPGQIEPYLQPYSEAGQAQLPILQEQFAQLLSNPNALLSQFGEGYQASPG